MTMMNRRNFLKNATAAGLSLGLPLGLGRQSAQAAAAYTGPCFLFVHADGGWDPRFLFDPSLDPMQNRLYTQVGEAAGIPFAPIPVDPARVGLPTTTGLDTQLQSPESFLNAHGDRLLVINGLDTTTNNHESGQRTMATGRLSEGFPVLAGLIAAQYGSSMPMSFLSGGGYDATYGYAPISRIADLGTLVRFGRPNEVSPNVAGTEQYHSSATLKRILKAQRARMADLQKEQHLPRQLTSMEALRMARDTDDQLGALLLQDELAMLPAGLEDLQQFERQSQLVLSAFSAGISVCGRVMLGGFDTHSDHDRSQSRQLWKLLGGLDFIVSYAAQKKLTDRLVVVVTSDFARGPQYNATGDAGGKDHWPVTSVLLMGPGIRGGRVIGATNDQQLACKVNPSTLDFDNKGVTLTSGHIHRELRRLAGIAGSSLAAEFPLPEEQLPLFE
jgi:uncharacterized protein (DUF1501 family)